MGSTMPKSWFTIKAAAEGTDVAEVSILDYIGMWGVNAQEFLREFRALKASTVKVYVNSPGGSVFEALAIFNGMRATGKQIEVHVLGVAASAASYIAMAGDKVVMPANTMMFVHNPINGVYGNAEELRAAADVLDKIGASLLATYRKRFKGTEEALQKLFADESYLTAAECLEYGFCDEVTEEIKAEAAFDVEQLPEAVRALFQATRPTEPPTPTESPLMPADIERIAAECKVPEFAGVLALDPTLKTLDDVRARAQVAGRIVELCRVTDKADQATAFVKARKSYDEVRAALADAAAAEDDKTVVNTGQTSASLTPPKPAEFNPFALWAEIHAVQKESYK